MPHAHTAVSTCVHTLQSAPGTGSLHELLLEIYKLMLQRLIAKAAPMTHASELTILSLSTALTT